MPEITQVSERSDEVLGPRDHVPELIAVGSFIAVFLLIGGLVVLRPQMPEVVTKVAPWAVIGAIVLYIRFGATSSSLLPARRVQRHERRAGALVGVLSALTVIAAIVEASSLKSWADWAILAAMVSLVIGGILMLRVRFTIGS